jgi:hypothetical protein
MPNAFQASVSIVERFGTPEQKAVLASAGIPLSPAATAEARAFTASASCPDRLKMSLPVNHTSLWEGVIKRQNEANGFK